MATPIGHSLAGYIIYLATSQKLKLINDWKKIIIFIFCANLPDLDYLPGFIIGSPNKFHHGITHSMGFAILFCVIAGSVLILKNRRVLLHYFIVPFSLYFSHVIIDYFAKDTGAPYGVKLLWPFTNKYFISNFSIFTDIHKASTSSIFIQSLFNLHNLWAISLEIVFLLPIVLLILILKKGLAKLNSNRLGIETSYKNE